MNPLIFAAICFATGVGIVAWNLPQALREHRERIAALPRDKRWDSTNAEVEEWADVLRVANAVVEGEIVDTHPEPQEPDPFGDELIGVAERAGEFAAALTDAYNRLCARRGPGRHRAVGLLDPRRAAIQAPTQQFAAIVLAETGQPLIEVGPREVDMVPQRSELVDGQWQQTAPLEVA